MVVCCVFGSNDLLLSFCYLFMPFSFIISHSLHYLLFKKKDFIYLFLERGERREKERERNINVQEIHLLVDSCTPPTGDLAHNPGMCPDWESKWWPFGFQSSTQSTEPHHPGQPSFFMFSWLFVLKHLNSFLISFSIYSLGILGRLLWGLHLKS